MKEKFFTKQRTYAILILLAMIFNMFSPYGVLVNMSYASSGGTPAPGEPYFKLSLPSGDIDGSVDYDNWSDATYDYYYEFDPDVDTIETYSGLRVVRLELSMNGCSSVNGGDIYLKYDTSKLIPAQETNYGTTKKPVIEAEEATTFENTASKATTSFGESNWGVHALANLDASSGTIRLAGTISPGDPYLTDGEIVCTFMFILADGVELEDLRAEDFSLLPATGLSEGLEITYYPDGSTQQVVDGSTYLAFEGFPTGTKKQPTSITLEGTMTKDRYYTGEAIDYSGLSLKIEYDDGTDETITDIAAAIAEGKITVDSSVASSAKKVVVSAGEDVNCDINYHIATGIEIGTEPTNTTFNHGDTIDFAGGVVNIIYDDDYKEALNIDDGIASGKLTADMTTADVNDTTVTLTYIDGVSTADINLTVNDPIDSIEITTMPTDVEYNHGEAIDVTGGEIKAIKRSGAEIQGISMSDTNVSIAPTTADINACTDTWQNGELTAGNQTITVTYEGKTAQYTVVVNDTITSIVVKSDPTAKNKYGTDASSLDYTGAEITVTTGSGNTFDIDVTAAMVNTTDFNPGELSVQNLPVTYAGQKTTDGNGINITLKDYIAGITVTAPSDLSVNYNEELDLTEITYVKNYASGATSTSTNVTDTMISGFNKTPAASDFNASHECTETITVTLDTPDDVDIDQVPATDTFTVKVKDVVTGIAISQTPNKIVYNYGDTFSTTGGRVQLSYASGAESSTISMSDSRISITELDGSEINMSPSSSEFNGGLATKTLKVTYTDSISKYDTTMNITIRDVLDNIEIATEPTTSFEHGDEFDVGSGTLKLIYKSGVETILGLDDGTTITETSSGAEVNMSPDASEYTNNEVTKNITVTYKEGVEKSVDYDITIKNTIDYIEIDQTPTTTYNLNDSTANVGGTIKVVRKAGNFEIVDILDPMVSGLDTSVAGNGKVATVTYTEDSTPKTTTYTYDVIDAVQSVEITGTPTKTSYNHGETLDLTGVTITVNYASGEQTVDLSNAIIEDITTGTATALNMSPAVSDYTNNQVTKDVKVSYTIDGKSDDITFQIAIDNNITGIAMGTIPTKTEYNLNDNAYDLANASGQNGYGDIIVTRAAGNTEVVALNEIGVTLTDLSTLTTSAGTKTVTVSYGQDASGNPYTTSFGITVVDGVKSVEVSGAPTKVNYNYGETLDMTGVTITVKHASDELAGGTTVDLSNATITEVVGGVAGTPVNMSPAASEFTSGNTLTKTIRVYYSEGNLDDYEDYEITIYNVLDHIEITTFPTSSYTLGDSIVNAGGQITIYRAADPTNSTEVVNIEDTWITDLSTQAAGVGKTATVSYSETDAEGTTITKQDTYTYDVIDTVQSVEITGTPTKTSYNHGETLDLTGVTITVNYASGEQTVDLSNAIIEDITTGTATALNMSPAVSDYTNNQVTKDVKVSYTIDGKSDDITFQITIKNNATGIVMYTTPKTEYNVNDTLDLTTDGTNYGKILVTRAIGEPEQIALNDSRVEVTGFDSTVEHTNLPLTVTFKEDGNSQTTTYNVNVKDTVKSIKLVSTPKTEYKYEEELDLSTLEIEVEKGSTTTTIPVTADMVSGYDNTQLGEQEITISYGGQDTKYTVKVKDYVTGITVNPSTVAGEYNDTLADLINDNSITYTVAYAKGGATSPVALTEDMIAGYDNTSIIAQNLTVTYTDTDTESYTENDTFEATLNVTLVDPITGIEIKQNPNKVDYEYGESLDLTGGIITVTRKSGKTEEITFNEAGVTLTKTDGSALDLNNITFNADHKAKETIQVNYEGQKATFDITITNKITGIVMENTPKTNYKVNETLDLTTDGTTLGTILVTRQNGKTESIKLDDVNVQVTGFDNTKENTKLQLTVSYTENLVTKTTNYTVSVIDTVIDVKIETTPKTNYKYGESLDVSTGTLKITRDSGEEIIPITANMVTEVDGTPFNSTNLGTRNLKVTYGGIDMTYEITVSDYVKGIILTPPTKLTYEYGEALDLTGGNIQKIMASGAETAEVPLSDSSVSISGYNPNQEGAQTINVAFEGYKESFGVIVEDNIQSITISTLPTKTQYKYGESLDLTGGKITATRSSGKTETIDITSSMVTGFNPNKLGEQELTVEYKGKTDTYKVNIEDYVTGISVEKPNKLVYKIGESVDLTGGKVKLTMASGKATSPVAMTDANVTITGFDTTSVGAKTITVNYKGFTETFGITVVDPLSGIVLKTLPNKTDYKYGESLDLTGATLEVTKESGATEIINVTKDMVTGYSPKKLGAQTLTVTYEGFTEQFIVNVEDYVSSLKVTKPDKVEYEYGESLDLTGGKVSIVMASGKIDETAEMTASMVSGFNARQEGTQTIKVEYKGLQGKFQVKVIDKIKGISINTEPDKTEYKYGESLDLTGATITVVKSSGITTIPVTSDMVSGYDATTPGSQIITVTYGGFTAKFVVNVNEQEVIATPEDTEEPEAPEKSNNVTKRPIKGHVTEEVQEEVEESKEEIQEETPVESPATVKKEEPTTVIPEEKNDVKETKDNKVIAGITGLIGLLFIFLLIFFRRNVKVYVEEDKEFVLGGLDKIKKKNPKLDIDKYLDEDTYPNRVKIRLNDSISEKLDGKEIEIKHRGKTIKHKVKYNDEPYEFILE